MLKIVEIFPSVQGEGLRLGEPAIFLRLSGCNLRCSFCDTKYAWPETDPVPVADILTRIRTLRRRFPADWICLTGGEPLIQDAGRLIRGLRKDGLKIQVETNGTLYRSWTLDWLTLSPKPPGYGCDPRFRRKAREVKLVVSKSLSFEVVRRLRAEFPGTTPLFFQPQSNAAWSLAKARRLLERSLGAGFKNIRLGVQLHKVYGLP